MGFGRGRIKINVDWMKDARGICNLVAFFCLMVGVILLASGEQHPMKSNETLKDQLHKIRFIYISVGAYLLITYYRLIGFVFDDCVTKLHKIRETVTDIAGAILLVIAAALAFLMAEYYTVKSEWSNVKSKEWDVLTIAGGVFVVVAAIILVVDAFFVIKGKASSSE